MKSVSVGFAMCGSFCTFEKVLKQMKLLIAEGAEIVPIMSHSASTLDTRFGTARDFVARVEGISGKKVIGSIKEAEPIGPQKMCDVLVVAPCTGNTLAKLACGIVDTTVTMAVKSHLRNGGPVVIGVSTNDGLAAALRNIAELVNRKNYFFVPFCQDDFERKPTSLVADFSLIGETARLALAGKQ
ncbi:MAG: dipicolinate synthase subunit B, partial [Oscillospiraceae bacterium]